MGKTIQLNNLSFAYNERQILKALNLVIGRKTFLSIIGPNGSGKTTLLKNIARNLKPTDGGILIDQRALETYGSAELAREMAVVHQQTDIGAAFTVHDVVMMGRNPHLTRFQQENAHDRQIADQAMQWTSVDHLKERLINEISGGERQRVMIAKALAQEPTLLLLDEPTSFLDIHHQIEILELLKKLNQEKGISVIAVIHDLNLAARYSQEVLLLHQGKVLALGATEKVMTAANLEQAYHMEMIIDRNAYTGSLQVCPVSLRQRKSRTQCIHVIGGGGMGKEVIQRLHQDGWQVSLGVVNKGDSDAELARRLGMTIIEEEPFSDIQATTLHSAGIAANKAMAVILTSIPIGRGNLANIQMAMEQQKSGKTVIHYNTYLPDVDFDYVKGEGARLLEEMALAGMESTNDLDQLMAQLEAMAHEAEA
ncbi:ABC transporter ATP-binding protein [Anoxynatronum buryatiense]|uniref:Iron complex transport system ATP-binding protein n=1 Tax=Anoxynatronum buryatiense TaxID=489973 RepID=A0AA45WSR0_9CLOT|nr:ABC transporter ATP-binding protein [Anoxynatronum buryatiense]SMP39044.1 iron complex transport system ATP-binding protein [Anoxynatronum buryatiense]